MDERLQTPQEIEKARQEKAIMKEMMSYFIYMAIPILITITIAILFAPNMTLP